MTGKIVDFILDSTMKSIKYAKNTLWEKFDFDKKLVMLKNAMRARDFAGKHENMSKTVWEMLDFDQKCKNMQNNATISF